MVSESNGDRILAAARQWIKTPWQHNQKCKKHGVDCVRFIEAIFKDELGYNFSDISAYARIPEGNVILNHLQNIDALTQVAIDDNAKGDLLLFRIGKVPAHLGIANEQGMIHADNRHGVIEINNLGRWQRRLVARFRVIQSADN